MKVATPEAAVTVLVPFKVPPPAVVPSEARTADSVIPLTESFVQMLLNAS